MTVIKTTIADTPSLRILAIVPRTVLVGLSRNGRPERLNDRMNALIPSKLAQLTLKSTTRVTRSCETRN